MVAARIPKIASEATSAKDRPSLPILSPIPSTTDAVDVPKSSKRIKQRLPPELDPGPPSDEPEMDSDTQFWTIFTLVTCLKWTWRQRSDYYVGANLSIYYYIKDPKSGRRQHRKLVFRGPDFFVVLNPFPKPRRNSWVIDNEGGKFPDVIVEVLSPKTKKKDFGEKKGIYERIFKTHEYYIVDTIKEKIFGWRLSKGRYVPIERTSEGLLWSERLGMFLGMYQNPGDELMPPDPQYGVLARLFTPDKQPIALPPEDALKQAARADAEALRARRAEEKAARAEREKARVEQEKARLLEKLRALGVKVDDL